MMLPPPPADELLHRVTYHAITRYVQRVMGVSVPGTKHMPEIERASLHCKCARTTFDEVRRSIMIPTVAVAVANKFAAIDTRNFTAVIDTDQQIIVTILEPRNYKKPKRSRRGGPRSESVLAYIAERVKKQIQGVHTGESMK
ncbi:MULTISPECIES: hypothetical protein [unclassified Brucella]|uniref:hypothetical protein n=1 Tax=unclassified Brucella TaxID=2632610 RepID=UPI0012AD639F|nr:MULTISPECIES: hypothetical protein [unclassified Brucella]MRN43446.1 hypothetical protein [Brucella sp. 09RB8913]MRN59421.1 hypothetical protein [Brucella sp. 09RB8918]MRN67984.1 hypothetical protein [Brucella sp. 10RB9213]